MRLRKGGWKGFEEFKKGSLRKEWLFLNQDRLSQKQEFRYMWFKSKLRRQNKYACLCQCTVGSDKLLPALPSRQHHETWLTLVAEADLRPVVLGVDIVLGDQAAVYANQLG